jgi:soluble P-type ATPase
MLEIEIPGYRSLRLSDLILDYNGTIAVDGKIIDRVKERLVGLSKSLGIHILTADTFGSVRNQLAGVACQLSIIPLENQVQAKVDYVRQLGCEGAVCIGNGRNDMLMLKEAALGIAVMQSEGGCIQAVFAADVVTTSVLDALDLLIHPLRLTATLRS